jgi:hypothetical protein
MDEPPPVPPSETGDGGRKAPTKLVFAPYDAPAGGWGALHATAKALREQSILPKGSKSLLSMNQPDGFERPSCAWPDPGHTSSFEFCENAYYPETNPLLPLAFHDVKSGTLAAKSILVPVRRQAPSPVPDQ